MKKMTLLKISLLLCLALFRGEALLLAGEEGNKPLEETGTPQDEKVNHGPVYFERSREGWFWYREMPELKKRKKVKEEKTSLPTALPPTLKEMRERAEALLSRAIEAPTEENVLSYAAYQHLVMQRAEEFSRTWQRILWQHPELDPTVENPVVSAGLSAASAEQAKRRDRALSHLAKESGLLYFFSGDCPLCEIQSPILASFSETYGFSVIAISLDGMTDAIFPEAKIDRGAARKLGVEKTPAVFLAGPMNRQGSPQTPDVLRVGTGLLSAEELAGRLYRLTEIAEKENGDQKKEGDFISDRFGFVDPPRVSIGPSGPSAAAR
jgi:conjugal transfer pilus assembly protein TraF